MISKISGKTPEIFFVPESDNSNKKIFHNLQILCFCAIIYPVVTQITLKKGEIKNVEKRITPVHRSEACELHSY